MKAAVHSIEIEASPEEVFDLLHDYDRRLEWDPFLRRADLLGHAREAAVGVSTLCLARLRSGGLGMETVYISFDRPRVAAVEMTKGPWFLASFAASIRQESLALGRTRVTYKFNFRVRPRWAAGILEPIFAAIFSGETRRRLRGLKAYLES